MQLIKHVKVVKVLREVLKHLEEEVGDNMPKGKGTYGSKLGRPKKRKKPKGRKRKTYASTRGTRVSRGTARRT